MSNIKMLIKNFFLALSGIVIIYGLYLIATKKEPAKVEAVKPPSDTQTGLAENGFPKTPLILKDYLTPLLRESMGFKENLGLDPQASASVDIGDTATVSCGYRFKDAKGRLAVSGKLQVSSSLEWHKDPSTLANKEKIQTMATAACLASLLDKKVLSDNEVNSIALVTTTDNGIQKALSNSGVAIGNKWSFNLIPTNPLEQMVWTLTER